MKLRLVALCERHVIRLGERLQQVAAGLVSVRKLPLYATMQETGACDAAIGAVAGGHGLQGRAVFTVHITRGAALRIACFGDKVGIAIHLQGIALLLAVLVVSECGFLPHPSPA